MCAWRVSIDPLTETVEVFENQRRPVLESQHESASSQGFHSSSLLLLERKNFSDRNGKQLENPSERPDAMLPEGEGWQWDGEWAVDATDADSEGWQYASNWIDPRQLIRGEDVKWYDACDKEGSTWVRRRRWVRQAVNSRTMSAQATSV